MAVIHRYGDKGTVVTAREKSVALLFVVGIVVLLVGRGSAIPEAVPAPVAHAGGTIAAPNGDNTPDTDTADLHSVHARAAASAKD